MNDQDILKKRELIVQFKIEGKTFRQIGEILKMASQSVFTQFHKGTNGIYKNIRQYNKSKYLRSGRDATRELARIRDQHTCQKCFKKWSMGTRRFDIHHNDGNCGIKTRSYDRQRDISTLITLCHKCHLSLPNVRNKMSQSH